MSAELARLLRSFRELNVLVIGESMLDSYLTGRARRLSPEAAVPIVSLDGCTSAPGGAANTAANVAALGARVTLLSVVGDDPEGRELRHLLGERGVCDGQIRTDSARRTIAKRRVMAGSQMLVRLDEGSTEALSRETRDWLLLALGRLFAQHDAVIVSDYGYGVIGAEGIEALAELQTACPRVLVVDAKQLGAYRMVGATVAKPNFAQAMQLLRDQALPEGPGRADAIARTADRILDAAGASIVVVTLDCDGAILLSRDRPPYRAIARSVPRTPAAGAGDTFASALALALAARADPIVAVEIASAAAAVVVAKSGTATCSVGELRRHVVPGGKLVPDVSHLRRLVADYRRDGCRIILTNGCFDILHRGHVSYLNAARALGDVLIVGVNSDDGVRRLKGPGRPINRLEDRLEVLAALSAPDHVAVFDEDTPVELIRAVRPDVFAKGGDYTVEDLPEAELVEQLGGTVRILPFVEGYSTTDALQRISADRGLLTGAVA
ncbi:MAG: D-glycero-beta-D-manno-heptose 1-phosphate adenylyltransferase [Chloroflexi bacterium]|nr:D-glycero-beta-D-manno-heptose 1-phosphate adenylyltransferase [Chloroflexota bacterium]